MTTINRSEILEMLAAGKITAAEAIDLLDAKSGDVAKEPEAPASVEELKVDEAASLLADIGPAIDKSKSVVSKKSDEYNIVISEDDLKSPSNGDRPRWLKIRVRDLGTGRNKVSVTLPIGLVNFGLGVARRFGADFDDDQNVEELWRMLKEGERGVLVNVEDEEDNEQVQIYLD
jgi:hypothetical protein